jgi:dihydrofolate reductase
MGKLVVGEFVSVDGIYQAPGGREEDRDGGFEHGGWTATYWDEEMGERITEVTLRSDALLLGRKTYEIFAGFWPNAGTDDPVAAKLNSVPKYIASRTLDTVDWNNSTVIDGDVAAAVTKLKQDVNGEIAVTGSGNLVQTLLKHDLVDVLGLWVFPVVLGNGKRLFGSGTLPKALQLTDTWTSRTGVQVNSYTRAGEIQTGDVG